MKELLKYTSKLFLFWLILFAVQRTVFLAYNFSGLAEVSHSDAILSYWYGLRMDLSASVYLSVLPLLFTFINLFALKKIWIRLSNILTCVFIVVVLITGLLDTGLYAMWGSKLNAKAFSYALSPGEALKSFNAVPVWIFMMLFLTKLALAFGIYLKWVKVGLPEKTRTWITVTGGILLIASLPVLMRGGFQKYPLSKNSIYYSRHMFLNYAALNGTWNAMDVLIRAKKQENPYRYFSTQQALDIVNEMQTTTCSNPIQIFNTRRPNIVLVLMESVSAENMMSLGGKESIMPGLDSLTHEGLLFNNFYATGFRTEQGLISYLSGFPAQPTVTIMREFGKFKKLPNLARILSEQGYSCNYYYSGNTDYANTRAYLTTSSFTKILDRNARPWQKFTEWGSLDEELFQCHLTEAGSDKQPFFSIIMTSTSHEPFDAPVTKTFGGNREFAGYHNTVHYTDSCIFSYIRQVMKTPWYAGTIFIITSDHAHYYPLKRQKYEAERHHIPLLIIGGALKTGWKGKTVDHIGSQVDLSATLLAQLEINNGSFSRSKNLMDTCHTGYAFYTFDNGFGLVTTEQTIVFDHERQQIVFKKENIPPQRDKKILNRGKAYLQLMFEEYLRLE